MASLTRLSLITLLNSMSDGLLWRGLYFFTHDHPELRFSDVQNLLLAFSQGALFTVSAMFAHRPARVLGERRLLQILSSWVNSRLRTPGCQTGPQMG